MEAATPTRELERDAELATLYGGSGDSPPPQPLLVEPWEEAAWDEESPLDAQIFAGLLRLSP